MFHLNDWVMFNGRLYQIDGKIKTAEGTVYNLIGEDYAAGNVPEEKIQSIEEHGVTQEELDRVLNGEPSTDQPISDTKVDPNKYKEWNELLDSIGKDDPPNAHYSRLDPQPIEYMQKAMTKEQFQGFCLGNVIKYALRFGHKDTREKEAQKIVDYAKWLLNSTKGEDVQL